MTIVITEVRNARSLGSDNLLMEVEINHPQHGWIPYGVNPADTDPTIDNAEVMALIGSNFAAYVAPDPVIPDTPENRRLERTEEFSQTLDKLNASWWDSLTDTEKTEVNTYRASWLDYPSTGVKPTRPSIFN